MRTLVRLPDCDLSIGVNRAAMAFAVDWFAASDYPMVRNHLDVLAGNPSLLTLRQTAFDLRNRLSRFPKVRIAEDLTMPSGLKYPKTMMLAALLAVALGATAIDVYGADWAGTRDYDGAEAGENRSDQRWAAERMAWQAVMVPWFKSHCVTARRV